MAHKLKTACASCYAVASALSRIQGVRVALTAFPVPDDNTSVCPVFRPGGQISDACLVTAHGSNPCLFLRFKPGDKQGNLKKRGNLGLLFFPFP